MKECEIQRKIVSVFTECEVHSFPVDCKELLAHYGYKIYSYTELRRKSKALYDMCLAYSEDAFRYSTGKIIAYNSDKPATRIHFSLAHELGHHVLGHQGTAEIFSDGPDVDQKKKEARRFEIEANYFASHLLAPRLVMYYADCRSAWDVSDIFQLSEQAARIAYDDYLDWHRKFLCRNRQPDQAEQDMYRHFYQKEQGCFVWSIRKCGICGKTIYNSRRDHYWYCGGFPEIPENEYVSFLPPSPKPEPEFDYTPPLSPYDDENMRTFRRWEEQWLTPPD